MAIPIFYGFNLLEQAGTIVTVSGEATGKPKERLFDREIELFYEDSSSAGTRIIKAQAASAMSLNGCGIGPGHNLNGATLSFERSPTGLDGSWTVVGTLVPATTGALVISGALASELYWRLTITGASAAPSIAELLFTRSVTFPYGTSEPGTRQGLVSGVNVLQGSAGHDWGAKRHEPRWFAEYLIRDMKQADRDALEQLYRDIDGGAKPFLVADADGALRWVRLVRPELTFAAVPVYRHNVVLELLEQF